jgi:hypothetical protein
MRRLARGLMRRLSLCGGLVTRGGRGATSAFLLVFLVLGVHGGGEREQQHNQCCPNPSAESGFTGSMRIH